eukprot:PhF_6_TR26184/c0_g1_i2/m.37225
MLRVILLLFVVVISVVGNSSSPLLRWAYDNGNTENSSSSLNPTEMLLCSLLGSPEYQNVSKVFIMGNVSLEERCEIGKNVSLFCDSTISITCPSTKTKPRVCFSIIELPLNATISLYVQGCMFFGQGINTIIPPAKRDLGLFDISIVGCGFIGNSKYAVLDLWWLRHVTIANSTFRNGQHLGTAGTSAGGCVSLKGVRGDVMIVNTSIRDCVSYGEGGCVAICGDVADGSDHEDPSTFGHGVTTIRNSLFSFCQSQTKGGLLSIRFMNRVVIEGSSFSHGLAKPNAARNYSTSVGGVLISHLLGSITFQRNVMYNCSCSSFDAGCLFLSAKNDTSSTIHTIQHSTFKQCRAALDGGCMSMIMSHGQLTVKNVTLEDCFGTTFAGGMRLTDIGPVSIQNVTFTRTSSFGEGGAAFFASIPNLSIRDLTVDNSSANEANLMFSNITTGSVRKLKILNARSLVYPSCISSFGGISFQEIDLTCQISEQCPRHYFLSELQQGNSPTNNTTITDRSFPVDSGNTCRDDDVKTITQVAHVRPRGVAHIIPNTSPLVMQSVGMAVATGSYSGHQTFTNAWLSLLLHNCREGINDETIFEKWVDVEQRSRAPPRWFSVIFGISLLTVVFITEGLWSLFFARCGRIKHPYYSLRHPNVSIRIYVIIVCELTADCITVISVNNADTETHGMRVMYAAVSSVVLLFGVIAPIGGLYYKFLRHVYAQREWLYHVKTNVHKTTTVLDWCYHRLLVQPGYWEDTELSKGVVRKTQDIFYLFTGDRILHGVFLTLFMSLLQGVVSGLLVTATTNSECIVLYGCSTMVYTISLIFVIRWGDLYHTPRDRIGFQIVLTTLILGSILRLVQNTSSVEGTSTRDDLNDIWVPCIVGFGWSVNVIVSVLGATSWLLPQIKETQIPRSPKNDRIEMSPLG